MSAELVTAIIAVASAIAVSLAAWNRFKGKLSQIRKLVDDLDDALYDDKLSEEEYRKIWEYFTEVVGIKAEK